MGCGASVESPTTGARVEPTKTIELHKTAGDHAGIVLSQYEDGVLRVSEVKPSSLLRGYITAGQELSKVDGMSCEGSDVEKLAASIIAAPVVTLVGAWSKGGRVPPKPGKEAPEPDEDEGEEEIEVVVVSEVSCSGVPPVDGSRTHDLRVRFTLVQKDVDCDVEDTSVFTTDDGVQQRIATTATMPNESEVKWHGLPLLTVPPDFTTGIMRVALWDDSVTAPEGALGKAVAKVTADQVRAPGGCRLELDMAGNAEKGLADFKAGCTLSIKPQGEAMRMKREAAKAVCAARAAREAERVAKAREAARAKKAREKAAREAREKEEAERAAAAAAAAAVAEEATRKAAEEVAAAEAAAAAAAEEERERFLAEAAEKKAAAEAAAAAERARLEAEAAAARAAAEAKAAEEALQNAEFTLILRAIAAHGVPDADAKPGSKSKGPKVDPYVRFTVMDVETLETGRTQPVYNSVDPVFENAVQVSLPTGTAAAMARHRGEGVRVKAEVYDKDLTDEDDRLGSAVITLDGGSGTVSRAALKGCAGFADCAVTFSYELTTEIAPAATLTLSGVSARDVPSGMDVSSGTGYKKAAPYLKFILLEVGDLVCETRLPTQPNSHNPTWTETCALELPRASPRPPMINVRLWDDDMNMDDDPIASTDVRLSADGEMTVELPIRKGLVPKGKPSKVRVTFKHTITVDAADEC